MIDKTIIVKKWRKETKKRIVEAFGNRCSLCRKTYPPELYELHHIDKSTKEFSIASKISNGIAWIKIVKELRKCVMLCANCHRLIEYGYEKIPLDANRFNEEFIDYKEEIEKYNKCPICGKEKAIRNTTCSLSCGARIRYDVDWDSVDLKEMWIEHKNYSKMGRILGCSNNAVVKRMKKLGIYERVLRN